ncbi:MAG: ABC transporter permease [Spirochaetales bacterium]|nr:ABC transporter permease [Spirochaetales bacterium]
MLRIDISPRENEKPLISNLILAASLLAGLAAIGVVFLAKGVNPFFAIYKIFSGSFGSMYGFKETVTKSIPLILIAAGLTIAYRGKFWNIGAESQLLAGAAAATWIALTWAASLPAWAAILLMFTGGFIAGALWGIVPAILRVRFGINEVISTLMLNYVGAEFIKMLVIGPWKGKTQFGFPYTDDFPETAQLALLGNSRIHFVTLIIALAVSALVYVLLFRTRFGYEVRVIGENQEAARYAGIDFYRTTIIIMIISGGLAGLAGVGEVAGLHHHLTYPESISSGYGFTAIIVAWLSRLNPVTAIFSGLFFAGILVGGDAIQISLNLPAATVNIFNGIILVFLIMGEFFQKNSVTIKLQGAKWNR